MIILLIGHFLRNTIFNVICSAVSVLICVLALDLIVVELLKVNIASCLPYYIFGAVTGVVTGFIFGGLCWLKPTVFFGDPYFKNPPRSIFVYLEFCLVFLIFTGCSVLSLCLFKNTFNSLMPKHDDWTILFNVLGSFAGSSLMYWLIIMFHFSGEICPSCHHMFCIDKDLVHTEKENLTQYKTKTTSEKIGSIMADDTEISSIYSDVTRGYQRNVTKTHKHFNCNCRYCNSHFNQSDTDYSYGKWE